MKKFCTSEKRLTSGDSVPGNKSSGFGAGGPGLDDGGAGVVEFDDIELVTVGIRATSSEEGVGPLVEGSDDGAFVDSKALVGIVVGRFEGADEGFAEGAADGGFVGLDVGAAMGLPVGGADVGE